MNRLSDFKPGLHSLRNWRPLGVGLLGIDNSSLCLVLPCPVLSCLVLPLVMPLSGLGFSFPLLEICIRLLQSAAMGSLAPTVRRSAATVWTLPRVTASMEYVHKDVRPVGEASFVQGVWKYRHLAYFRFVRQKLELTCFARQNCFYLVSIALSSFLILVFREGLGDMRVVRYFD